VDRGTGLGLSISLGIVRDHGGQIELDARSRNTRFYLRLPRPGTLAVAV
jgi:signal transduction histidine kinase